MVPGESVFVGGVRNFSHLIDRPGQLSCFSFAGCIRAFEINQQTLETIGTFKASSNLFYLSILFQRAEAAFLIVRGTALRKLG